METAASIFQVVLALGATLLLVFGIAFLARKVMAGADTVGGAIQVVAVKQLTAKERLLLVQVGERQILLGVTQQSINALERFPAE